MTTFKHYKQESRGNWGTTDEKLTLEQINTGAILRIADATEKMVSNYVEMENSLKYYKELSEKRFEIIKKLTRSNSARKGQITKLKSKIKQ